jgi:mannose-1-phosphate guanylyltransferase
MYVVILAGGSGTRFWPLSRRRTPKQLMSVFGGKSMLQRTVERVLPLKPKRVMVITNADQAQETATQLASLKGLPLDIIAEPVGRNTAPAIGLAASIIASHDPTGMMVVLPADHYIGDEEEFRQTVSRGKEAALNGYLVTFGIRPVRPETGYGYIEAEEELRGAGPFPVKRFVEKPPLAEALELLAAGNYYWNSGIFMWRSDIILDKIFDHMPELSAGLAGLTFSPDIWDPRDLQPQIDAIYREIRGESIDFGVMEKADNVVVIPARFDWSDVGSWNAMGDVLPGDDAGNCFMAVSDTIVNDAGGCIVHGDGRAVALVGVRDLVVVATGDALLVCDRKRAQDVKKVVEELERRGKTGYL